jgi:hypothetical protein
VLWSPFVNVSDVNVIPFFSPSQVGDYFEWVKAVVIDNHVLGQKKERKTFCYGKETPTGGKATPTWEIGIVVQPIRWEAPITLKCPLRPVRDAGVELNHYCTPVSITVTATKNGDGRF